ncbi:hypothetical protein FZX15_07295 [Brucella suis bv. 1]|nr:hypothetical protein FZX15_07295 [Brucella suis bv. 1]
MSSHSTGQRAAILADLAIAPFSKTLLGRVSSLWGLSMACLRLAAISSAWLSSKKPGLIFRWWQITCAMCFETYRRTGRFETFRSC